MALQPNRKAICQALLNNITYLAQNAGPMHHLSAFVGAGDRRYAQNYPADASPPAAHAGCPWPKDPTRPPAAPVHR
jgi:hypothetical protein